MKNLLLILFLLISVFQSYSQKNVSGHIVYVIEKENDNVLSQYYSLSQRDRMNLSDKYLIIDFKGITNKYEYVNNLSNSDNVSLDNYKDENGKILRIGSTNNFQFFTIFKENGISIIYKFEIYPEQNNNVSNFSGEKVYSFCLYKYSISNNIDNDGNYSNYKNKIYISEIIEILNFNEEKEYKLLDNIELELKRKEFSGIRSVKILSRECFKFSTYVEASKSRNRINN